jgi:hypothetical protein
MSRCLDIADDDALVSHVALKDTELPPLTKLSARIGHVKSHKPYTYVPEVPPQYVLSCYILSLH